MIELHIGNKNYSSWSLRPWVLMRQLGIPFVERLHPFPPNGDGQAIRALSPSGKVPCLVDDAVGLVVWDSLAIAEYLHERFPGVWPEDRAARVFARCAAAEMHSGFAALRSVCSMSCGVRVRLSETGPALQLDLERLAALLSAGLTRFGGPFLAGASFSAADAFYAPVAFRAQTYHLELPEPAGGYLARLLDLPAMREWYEAALGEPWREPEHDADTLRHGALEADLRGG